MEVYSSRLKNYVNFQIEEVYPGKKDKKKEPAALKRAEAAAVMKHLRDQDYLVLLDEKGKQFSSAEFADYLQKRMNTGLKRMIFLVGGAYGFDKSLKQRADHELSLSKMTFPHQLIRLVFLEQLYRAITILHNEPYHNE